MNIEDEILGNPILRNVQAKFQNQQVKGLAKYGETVNPESYSVTEWDNHLQQELIDAVVYIEVRNAVISQIMEENKRLREALEEIAKTEMYDGEQREYYQGQATYMKITALKTLHELEESNNGL